MRAECIAAVRAAAEAIGKQLTLADIQGIDAKMYQKQKILAKQDIAAWRAMSRKEQLTKAGESVVQDAIHDAIKKRARANLTILSQQKREQTFGKMIASGMTRMDALRHYTFFKADGKGGVMSMESHSKAITHSYLGKIQALRDLENQGSIGGLVTNKQGMLDYLKESYGIDSGNPLAKRAWQEVDAARNQMIDDFNRVGGDVAKLTNYRNPQGLDAYRVITRGGDGGKTFVDDHMKLVDKSEYNNPDGSPMTDGQLRNFLHEAFVTVSTDGANKPMSEGGGGASAVANRMRAHRQIHYKSPEAYLFAMEKYGAGNPFDQTRSSFEAMARDIALVEKFGPNAINEFNKEFNRATLEMTSKEARSLFNSPGGLRASFERFSGQRTVSNVRIAEIGKTTRSSMVANKLGMMLFAQLADTATLEATARAMNIPKSEILKWHTVIITDPHLRENLGAHGHGVEIATNNVARFADDSSSSGFYGKAATAVTTIQGAHVWTRGLRQVFSAMMEAKYGGMVSRYTDMSKLHERDRALLESKGVDDTDWAIWRMAKPDDYKGSKLLSARSLEDVSLEDITKVIPDRVKAIHDQSADLSARMTAQNIKEAEWVASRAQKLSDYHTKIQKMIGEYESVRDKREGEAAQQAADYIEYLTALQEDANVSHFQSTTIASMKNSDAIKELVIGAQAIPDIGDVKLTGVEMQAVRGVSSGSTTGVDLGRVRAFTRGAINKASRKVDKYRTAADKEIFAKAAEFEKRVDVKLKDLTEFNESMMKRAENRAEIVKDWESKIGDRISQAAFDARRDAALKLQAMMVEETHMAVLQPSELQGFDYARGTVVGEIGALILQFKSFPWALFRQHFIDRANFKAAGYNPTAYRARLLVTSTILGGAALILNDLASGKDPREVFGDDPEKTKKFAMQAMLKGGGLPVMGDILELGYGSVENPYQTKTSVLGPALGFTVGTVVPTMGTGLKAMYTGDDKDLEDFTKNAYDSVRGVTPGQNLWFLKGFLHNVMLKDLQETANPGYTERARQRAEKNYGTGYWMGMDEETRPPDLSNISGQ